MDGLGRRNRSGETWAAARAAYLDGQSAGEVCARFGLGLSALRARARRDGWRRMDQPDPDPDLGEDLDEELEDRPADFVAMADRAARLASRALHLGEAAAADRWTRLYLRLQLLAAEQTRAAELRESRATRAAVTEARRAAAEPDVHSVHPVHPDPECTSDAPATGRIFNRADRRRRERLAAYQAKIAARPTPVDGP